MIRKSEDKISVTKPGLFGEKGEMTIRNILNGPEEMEGKGRMFAHITIHPNSAVGFHKHNGDAETYYIVSGTGKYSDNGNVVDVHPGDVFYCPSGEGHSIEAGDEPIEMIALILYK